MRTREHITDEYLSSLEKEISSASKHYQSYANNWLHKDKATAEKLGKLFDDGIRFKNNLAHYHQILQSLHECYKQSRHQQQEDMQTLHDILLRELNSQKECRWNEIDEDIDLETRIQLAINNLGDHTIYDSTEIERFAAKWNIPSYHLNNKKLQKSWEQMLNQQAQFVQADYRLEIEAAVRIILQLDSGSQPDFFILQTPDAEVQRLKDQRREFQDKLNRAACNHQKMARKKTGRDNTKEHECAALIKTAEGNVTETTRSIHAYQIRKLLKKDRAGKTALEKLKEYYDQLSLWTERNLEIFFIENFILSQIRNLKRTESSLLKSLESSNTESHTTLPDAKKMVDHLAEMMRSALESVSEAYDKIHAELRYLQEIIDGDLVDTNGIELFTCNKPAINPAEAADSFKNFAQSHLLQFTTSRQFEFALQHARHEQVRGIILPEAKHVIEMEEAERIHPPAAIDTSDFTLIPIVDNDAAANTTLVPDHIQPDLHRNAAAQPRWYQTTPGKMLLGAAIGLGVACLVGGIVAAIIFSGGAAVAGMAAGLTIAAKLGTVGTASLFASIGIAGCVTGMIGGIASALHRQNTTPASLSSSGSYRQISKSLSLGNLNSHTASILLRHASSPALIQQHPACQRTHGFFTRSTKSQPLLALPSAQNQVLSSAPTPNASPR